MVKFDRVCKVSWAYRYVRSNVDTDHMVMLYTLYTGICEVEPTPKGWFIKYIDRDPETIKRQAVG